MMDGSRISRNADDRLVIYCVMIKQASGWVALNSYKVGKKYTYILG